MKVLHIKWKIPQNPKYALLNKKTNKQKGLTEIKIHIHTDLNLKGYCWTDVFILMTGDNLICRDLWFGLFFHPEHSDVLLTA